MIKKNNQVEYLERKNLLGQEHQDFKSIVIFVDMSFKIKYLGYECFRAKIFFLLISSPYL